MPTRGSDRALTGVAFIDSAGINALLKGRRAAEGHGQTLVVTDASGLVRGLLEMTVCGRTWRARRENRQRSPYG